MIRTIAPVLSLIVMLSVSPFVAVAAHHAKADIVDTAVSAGSFNTLVAAVKAAGLVDTLKGEGPFTVFAPTDDAFAKLPEGTLDSLLKPENKEKLIAILTYHVVAGKVMAKDVVKLNGAETVNGQRASIVIDDKTVMVDNAKVIKTDIKTSNGVIHVIDSVILPSDKTIVETAAGAGSFNTLIAAAKAAGLAGVLSGDGPFTVFAPTDDAFAKLPAGTVEALLKPENKTQLQKILKLHVVESRAFSETVLKTEKFDSLAGLSLKPTLKDGKAFVNGVQIAKTDINASNGVIHVIDSVILPKEEVSSAHEAREMIRTAINHGAPMYNHGNSAGCAAMYTMAAKAITSSDAVCSTVKAPLMTALANMEKAHGSSDQAWIMRRGLDEAYEKLSI
ncbi:MAG: fasciclin domain-containing protein [Candidatus Hinthialibacter antarcticus]|nr:fasciclin domain-containing protein [Candidatus Hinthialibacter antarcticus]